MIPVTAIGKILGSVCCLSGIIMLTLPIPIIQEGTMKTKELWMLYTPVRTCKASYEPEYELHSTPEPRIIIELITL